jgi:hypothetical protein
VARSIRSATLETRTARLKLPVRKKPYTVRVAPGVRLAYRRNQAGGVWSVLRSDGAGGSWLKRFALADDHEDANGATVLTFWEAQDMARKLARGDDAGEVETGRPMTVGEAVDAYERDLIARDGDPGNAKRVAFHLAPALKTKPVAMLTARDVRGFRDLLLGNMSRASVNRTMNAFCAAMTLAANDDERITNAKAWRIAALPDATTARNVILNDTQVRDAITASYETGGERFGVYVEVLGVTGTRPIQARRLLVGDLEADYRDGPRVLMPSSRKGKGRKRIDRVPVPIPAGLAARLAVEAEGRGDDEPLLRDDDGNAWDANGHPRLFATAAAAAKLPKGATAYALRHSSIVRALLKGVPVRLVAATHDTSTPQIEAHYSKYIATPGADLMRGALLDRDAAPAANVVSLARKAS